MSWLGPGRSLEMRRSGRSLCSLNLRLFQRQIADSKAEVTAIREPVREQLLAKRKKDGQPAVGGQEPIAAWDFGKGTEDQLGQLNLSLIGGAKVVDGALLLDGKSAFARCAPPWPNRSAQRHSRLLRVQLSYLDQRWGGSGVGTDAERPHLRRHRFRRAQFETVAGWKR